MNLFLNACGMLRPLQLEVEHRISHRIEIGTLDRPFAVIGRDPSCDIVLGDKQVSRRHAYVQVIAGRPFWVDLDSQLGTFVEGQAWKSGWIGTERSIAIGPNDIRQVGGNGALPSSEEALPQGSPLIWRGYGREDLAEVTIEFMNGPSESKTWPIRRVLSLIGTARRCKFRLADRSIEPFHCSLVRTARGLFVVDLLGGAGTRVNDIPTTSTLLKHGDLLEVGRYQIRIHYRDARGVDEDRSGNRNDRSLVPMNQTGMELPAPLLPVPIPSPVSQAELLPYGPNMMIPATGGHDITQSVLVPLVTQFGMMQQQMFDQFQQTMNMMVQMFGKMHESQMELIRQEFDRLNDLTTEIDSLKQELAEMTRKRAESPAPDQTSPIAPMVSPIPSALKTRPQDPKPEDTVAIPRAKAFKAPSQSADESSAAQPEAGQSASESETRPQVVGEGQNDRDAIVWLHQRISSIQKEREGRWQKIMRLIPGSS